MEISEENENFQYLRTEKILPCVINVEETSCLLCCRLRKFYCCRHCYEQGHLSFLVQTRHEDSSDNQRNLPGFISQSIQIKRSILQDSNQKTNRLLLRVKSSSVAYKKREILRAEVVETRKKIEILKHVKRHQQRELSNQIRKKQNVKSMIEQLQRRSERVQMKISKIKEYMASKTKMNTNDKTELKNATNDVGRIRKQQVGDLVSHIFPIVGRTQDDVFGRMDGSVDQERKEMQPKNILEEELAEARQLSFVHGRWIYDQGEGLDIVRISIGSDEACAPADGDYSASEAWIKSMIADPNDSPEPQADHVLEPHRSLGASIFAAVCFATQLMYILRNLLCIHMPYRLHYRKFFKSNLSTQEFTKNVRRLNGNAISFCLLNGVEPHLIHPLHTLPNVEKAVQAFLEKGMSSISPLLSPELIFSIEEALNDRCDPLLDDDDDNFEDTLTEWENSLVDEEWDSLMLKQSQDRHQYVSAAPFQSVAHQEDMRSSQAQGLVSSAMAWMSKTWWNK